MNQNELNNIEFSECSLLISGVGHPGLITKTYLNKDWFKQFNVWVYYIDNHDLVVENCIPSNAKATFLCGERFSDWSLPLVDGYAFTGEVMAISEYLAQYKPNFFKMEDDLKAQCVNYMQRAIEAIGPIHFSDHNQPYINQMPIVCVSIDDDGFFIAENAESNKLIHESAMNVANLFDLAKAVYNQLKQ